MRDGLPRGLVLLCLIIALSTGATAATGLFGRAVAMAGAICAMLLSAWVTEGALEVGGCVIFAGVLTLSGGLGIRMYRSVRPAASAAR